ncbi:MAG TPA: TRAP transporter small permease [Acidobacteriota bacterium]|nr:TRAP transporter small permease [Acidobacteriota bacterium]HRR25286.1 TRAP transporter small permease [Acidobacteriota bacterium]HRR55371.1 TRAP transporter small permease [Acidobacteriota bacterium]HRV07018.1 TRAP transporter small permease [Acidobacteriota bacterium]
MSVETVRRRVTQALEWLLVLLMGIMVLNVLWQVWTRFVLRHPSSYTEELARYLLIWLGLLGAAYGVGRRVHLSIDLVPTRLPGRHRLRLELLIELLVFLFAVSVLVVGGARLVSMTLFLGQVSAALQVKLGYVYLAIPLSGCVIAFFSTLSAWEKGKKLHATSEEERNDESAGGRRA